MKQINLQFGIFSWFGYRLHMVQRARLIKKAGFETTCIWWGEEEKENTGSLHDLPAIVRDAGLVIDNIHAPFADCNDIWSTTTSIRQDLTSRYLTWLDDCARHQIPKMVIHLTDGPEPPGPNQPGLEELSHIFQAAKDRNIIIAIENTQCTDHLDFVFSQFDLPSIGLCYDSSHDFLWSGQPTEILAKWGQRLVTTHISDNDGAEDDHWIPNEGIIDWPKLAEAFPRKTYTGPLMLEVVAKNLSQKPELYLKDAYENLCSFAKLLPKVK